MELPDGTMHRVGSGTYEWVVDDRPRAVSRRPLDLDTGLATVADDRRACAEIVAVLDAEDAENARILRANTVWSRGQTLRESVLRLATPAVQRMVVERLQALSSDRR